MNDLIRRLQAAEEAVRKEAEGELFAEDAFLAQRLAETFAEVREWIAELDEKRTLPEWAAVIEDLRHSLLCSEVSEGTPPFVSEYLLLALASLEQAQMQLKLAGLHYAREVAGRTP